MTNKDKVDLSNAVLKVVRDECDDEEDVLRILGVCCAAVLRDYRPAALEEFVRVLREATRQLRDQLDQMH